MSEVALCPFLKAPGYRFERRPHSQASKAPCGQFRSSQRAEREYSGCPNLTANPS